MPQDYVLPAPPVPSVPVDGTDARFPVNRVFCVGRNYAEHAREMGNDPDREPPFFFDKPAAALTMDGADVPYPPATGDLHYEGELVVAIAKGGRDIPVDTAMDHVWGYAAGNDLTRRDMQWDAKALKRPWDMAKGFDHSAVVGTLKPVAAVGDLNALRLTTRVNGEVRQDAGLNTMIWPVPDVIAYLSGLVELQPGDLIMTGTPAGVGPLSRGDTCEVRIEGIGAVAIRIT